ncbi:albumin-1 isoform X2 [Cajanus cajan]|nr:albumin-1 isoform X2 [Cajanus cajan]
MQVVPLEQLKLSNMACVRLAPLALFLLATSLLFRMKKIEAGGNCLDSFCNLSADCGLGCTCVFGACIGDGLASVAKMVEEHPNLCQSHDECVKKGSGNFCARYLNPRVDYGLCFDSDSQGLKEFLAMPTIAE